MNLEIHKTLVVSTAHLTKEVAEMYNAFGTEDEYPCDLMRPRWVRNEGWMLYVPETITGLDVINTPDCISDVIAVAIKNKCQWIMFDSDGPLIEGLPVFKW